MYGVGSDNKNNGNNGNNHNNNGNNNDSKNLYLQSKYKKICLKKELEMKVLKLFVK